MAISTTSYLESTLTDRYQTTIPESIRKSLGLNKRDKICYAIQSDGTVLISRVEQSDPILGKFLDFLTEDIEKNPQHLTTISPELVNRVQSLVADVEVNLDVPLLDEDE